MLLSIVLSPSRSILWIRDLAQVHQRPLMFASNTQQFIYLLSMNEWYIYTTLAYLQPLGRLCTHASIWTQSSMSRETIFPLLLYFGLGWSGVHNLTAYIHCIKQDQGSKAPSGHTSFYLCPPFYQVYLSILSFAPSTFLPSWPYIIVYHSILQTVYLLNLSFAPCICLPIWPHIIIYHRIPQIVYLLNLSFAPSTVLPSLSFYQVYLLNLSFAPSIPKYHNCEK